MNNFTPHSQCVSLNQKALQHHRRTTVGALSKNAIIVSYRMHNVHIVYVSIHIFRLLNPYMHTHSLVPHAYSRICVCLTEERIRMRSALAWIELNETRSLALCGTFTAAESIRDGRPQQKQQLLCVWATIRVMCRHFWNNRFSYQWDWCRYSLDWWCARAAFKNGSK